MPKVTLDYRYSSHAKEREYYLGCDSVGHWFFWLGFHVAKALGQM
jgi:hypothetical protein